jgi:hypothetical protein
MGSGGNTWRDMPEESCPQRGETHLFRQIQRVDLGPGVRYEAYACARCGASFEREEAKGWAWTPAPGRPARSA